MNARRDMSKGGNLARVLISYTTVKQESILTKNTISLLIYYCRRQISESLVIGINVLTKMPWQYKVGALSKDPDDIEGIFCARCMHMIPLFSQYYRRRSNHTTKTYHIECAERMGLRR
jgi:hypothetical protein